MRLRDVVLFVFVFCACKKHEPVQQAAPTEGPLVAATAPPSASVEPLASAVPTSALASATPHEPTAAEAQAEREAAKKKALEEAREYGMIGIIGAMPVDAGELGLGGTGTGMSIGAPRDAGSHSISVRQGAVTVNGRLPPEVIQRIVRQNFGRFRLCYQEGVRKNPSLQGRVAVKYTIGHDGSVTQTQDGGSDMPDQNVVQCVVRAFGNLSYPQPEGGIVTVVFPLIFSPGS
jgi:hypothetical protein